MELGYGEDAYLLQQQEVRMLSCRPKAYPDLVFADAGWTLTLIEAIPRDAVVSLCRRVIDSRTPVICWGTDMLHRYGWPTPNGYLLALWSHGTRPDLTAAFGLVRVLEQYAGHHRVREIFGNPIDWAMQFAANLFLPEHLPIIAELERRSAERERRFLSGQGS